MQNVRKSRIKNPQSYRANLLGVLALGYTCTTALPVAMAMFLGTSLLHTT